MTAEKESDAPSPKQQQWSQPPKIPQGRPIVKVSRPLPHFFLRTNIYKRECRVLTRLKNIEFWWSNGVLFNKTLKDECVCRVTKAALRQQSAMLHPMITSSTIWINSRYDFLLYLPTCCLVPAFNNPDTWDIAKFFPLLPLLSSVFLGYLLIVFLLFKYLYLSIYDVIMECFVLQQMLGGVRPFPHAQQRQQVPNSVSL